MSRLVAALALGLVLATPRRAHADDVTVAKGLAWGGIGLGAGSIAGSFLLDDDHPVLARRLGMAGGSILFFAPAFGHWYAGDWWTRGLTIRTIASFSGAGVLFVAALLDMTRNSDDPDASGTGSNVVLYGILIGVAAAYVYGAYDDIATTDDVLAGSSPASARVLSFGGTF